MAADWIEWEGLGKAEFDAHQALNPEFEAYESSVAGKYNVVDRVLGLSVSRQALDTMVIGACLVRALNDLRSVWLLLRMGYTAQAATVAASCWEYSMTAEAIAGSEETAREFLNHRQGTRSWSAKQLAKRVLTRRTEIVPELAELTPERYQSLWATNYALYCWLCQIKHPTEDALAHAASAKISSDGRLTITGGPDCSLDDSALRAVVLAIASDAVGSAIGALIGSVRAYAEPTHWELVSGAWSDSISERLQFPDGVAVPITLAQSPFAEEFLRLRDDAIRSEQVQD